MFDFSKKSSEILLETDRLLLRNFRSKDYEEWGRVRRLSHALLQPWEPKWSPDDLTLDHFLQRLVFQEQEQKAGRMIVLLACHKQTGKIVGGVTLSQIIRRSVDSGFLGYWTSSDQLRQGYAYESVSAFVDYVFEDLKLHRIQASCMPANHPSLNLLSRLGFEKEGFAKEFLNINGRREDHLLFAKINSQQII
jgi:[ribosomal protein S5]-alanine N-acetyltransferase